MPLVWPDTVLLVLLDSQLTTMHCLCGVLAKVECIFLAFLSVRVGAPVPYVYIQAFRFALLRKTNSACGQFK